MRADYPSNNNGEESAFIIKSMFLHVIKKDDLCNLNKCLVIVIIIRGNQIGDQVE